MPIDKSRQKVLLKYIYLFIHSCFCSDWEEIQINLTAFDFMTNIKRRAGILINSPQPKILYISTVCVKNIRWKCQPTSDSCLGGSVLWKVWCSASQASITINGAGWVSDLSPVLVPTVTEEFDICVADFKDMSEKPREENKSG